MSKQRILTSILMPLCFMFACLFLGACDNDSNYGVKEINIDQYQTQIEKNSQYDYDGVVVKATRNDDSFIIVPHDEKLTFSTIDTQTVGNQDLVATYKVGGKEFTSTKQVLVYGDLDTIGVKANTYKNKVNQGSVYDGSNIVVLLNYEGGLQRESALKDLEGATIALNTTVLGPATATITYQNKQATFSVQVVKEGVRAIAFDAATVPTEINKGAVLNTSNIRIVATKTDDSYVVLSSSEYQFSAFNSSTAGVQPLTVTYLADTTLTATTQIKVYGDVVSIAIKSGIADTAVVGQTFDVSNLVLTVNYEANMSKDLSYQEICNDTSFSVTNISTTSVGGKILTIQYKGQSISKTINVLEPYGVKAIAFDPTTVPTEINKNAVLDTSNIRIVATRNDDSYVALASSEYQFSTFHSDLAGVQPLTVTYLADTTLTDTIEIKVYGDVISIAIKSGVAESVMVGQTLNVSNLVLTVNYEENMSKDLSYAQISNDASFNVINISTSSAGEKTLTIQYKGQSISKTIDVLENYIVTGLSQAESYANYLINSQKGNTYTETNSDGVKGFTVLGNPYLVGYDNEFVYSPVLQVFNTTTTTTGSLLNYNADIKVFKVVGNQETELDLDNNEFVTVTSAYMHKFQFTSQAAGKIFRIEIFPSNATVSALIAPVSATVKVVEGYNVYTAKELSLIDNVNAGGKWTAIKTECGLENVTTNAIILHDDITIEAEDIPSIHFWTATEVGNASDVSLGVIGSLKDKDIGYDSIYTGAAGAALDSSQVLGNIYRRMLRNGESFTIEGNYFQLSAQNVPLIVRESGDSVAKPDAAIVSHTALLGVEYENMTTLGSNAQLNINNISLFGNANKNDNYKHSGGVMFLKTRNVKTNINNNLSQSWYMSYMFRGPKPTGTGAVPYTSAENSITPLVNMKDVNAFDAYNTILYLQGVGNIKIDSCIMIGAGGPVMIVDHAKDQGAAINTGRPVNIIVTDCVLESYIAGTEGWFESMAGSGALVSQIKGLDQIIDGFTKQAKLNSIPNAMIKTMLKLNKLNLIAVFKSDNTAGIEDEATASTFTDTSFTNGLQMSRYANLVNGGANVLETFNGGWFVPTDTSPYVYAYGDETGMASMNTNPADAHFGAFLSELSTAQKYLAGYLSNKMGILLGFMDNSNQSLS